MNKCVPLLLLAGWLGLSSPADAARRSNTSIESNRAAADGFWTDNAAAAYASGKGTQADPYIISSAEQLALLALEVDRGQTTAGSYYRLSADIDLDGHYWYPIGADKAKPFEGHFDGMGHHIDNLHIVQTGSLLNTGFFSAIAEGATVRNLVIAGGSVEGDQLTAVLVGYNQGTIEDCTIYASCSSYLYASGIAATNHGIVRRCINHGTMKAMGANGMSAAGIVASNYGFVYDCANYGSVSADAQGAGGIVALAEKGMIARCYNRGEVTSVLQVGGIAATVLGRGGDVTITACYNASNISGGYATGQIFGLAQFLYPNKFTCDSLYCDGTLSSLPAYGYTNPGVGSFSMGTHIDELTTGEMTAAAFVDLLNAANKDARPWVADTEGYNGGYPLLAFQQAGYNAISKTLSQSVKVSVEGRTIKVEGATRVVVATVGGRVVFDGPANGLQHKPFAPGLYLVKAGGKATKVVV